MPGYIKISDTNIILMEKETLEQNYILCFNFCVYTSFTFHKQLEAFSKNIKCSYLSIDLHGLLSTAVHFKYKIFKKIICHFSSP